jgi:hypothetical protein
MQRYWLVGGVTWIWECVLCEICPHHGTYISKVIQHPPNVVEAPDQEGKDNKSKLDSISLSAALRFPISSGTRSLSQGATFHLLHVHFTPLTNFLLKISVRQRKTIFRYTSASSAILPVNLPTRSAAPLTKRAEKRAGRARRACWWQGRGHGRQPTCEPRPPVHR